MTKLLRYLNLRITTAAKFNHLKAVERDIGDVFDLLEKKLVGSPSRSQLKQDLFVLLETGFKRNGFFVEFGATNGVDLSNSWLLETGFGWDGILAEPAKVWHADLTRNRKAKIDFDCVWKKTGDEFVFNEVSEAELSTLQQFNDKDRHARKRRDGVTYAVKTVSLVDLLKRHGAPHHIDYLSIDTEGSEFEILNHFDFDAYNISIITCEHNHTQEREKIYGLLTSKGYVRKFEGISKWDDWYVRQA